MIARNAAARIGCTADTYAANRARGMRWCWWHGEWHEGSAFGHDAARPDGVAGICRRAASAVAACQREDGAR